MYCYTYKDKLLHELTQLADLLIIYTQKTIHKLTQFADLVIYT